MAKLFEFRKPAPSSVSSSAAQSASVGNAASWGARLFDELMVAPDEQSLSYRDRIVLMSSDGVEFFTHASITSHVSPTLRTFYHGGYDAVGADSVLAARIVEGTGYRSFRLEEADRQTLDQLMRFVYLNECPKGSPQFCKLVEVCHFLELDTFLCRLVEFVEKIVEEKSMTADELGEMMTSLKTHNNHEAFEVIVKAATKSK